MGTGRPPFVGAASMEIRVSDGLIGELLAAGVDRRVGGKSLNSSAVSWADVENALEYWAAHFAFRLCQESHIGDCKKPWPASCLGEVVP